MRVASWVGGDTMARRERPLMSEEQEAIRKLSTGGMSAAAIAVAMFLSKRQTV